MAVKTLGVMSKSDLEAEIDMSTTKGICFLCHTPIGQFWDIVEYHSGTVCICFNCLNKIKFVKKPFLRLLDR